MTDRMIIISGVLAYLMGSVTFGMIVPKLMGSDRDVREEGSGNVGATNVLRTMGLLQGALVLAGDLLKGVAAVALGSALAGPNGAAAAGACALLGHCYPVYYGFKGGKGAATGGGVVLALFPKSLLIMLPVFLVVILITRMVSLGSILGALTLILCVLLFQPPAVVAAVCLFAMTMVVVKHKDNIRRILNGTENKLW
ncbi:MAG: glycerol-3-phosphate 1-O-acyltransferase PlsY [Clostridiales bacterium]|nr:glycerol-3-phosphate 1-O-acyltransferase PlsY [Clostridiales bacterium]